MYVNKITKFHSFFVYIFHIICTIMLTIIERIFIFNRCRITLSCKLFLIVPSIGTLLKIYKPHIKVSIMTFLARINEVIKNLSRIVRI